MASSTLFLFISVLVFFCLASSFSKAAYSNKKSNEPNFNYIFVKATSRKAHKRLILFQKLPSPLLLPMIILWFRL
ncbi:hypothetical protein AB3S75_041823 [Citrus x aurantiifolia]